MDVLNKIYTAPKSSLEENKEKVDKKKYAIFTLIYSTLLLTVCIAIGIFEAMKLIF